MRRFCLEYLSNGFNATAAAKKAGYSEKTAHTQACNMLKEPKVVAFIEDELAEEKKKSMLKRARIINELEIIAYSDIKDFVEIIDGKLNFKNIEHLSRKKTAAVKGISEGKVMTKIELHDKLKALELLGKHHGMFREDDIDNTQPVIINYTVKGEPKNG